MIELEDWADAELAATAILAADYSDGTCHHFPNYCNCQVASLAAQCIRYKAALALLTSGPGREIALKALNP